MSFTIVTYEGERQYGPGASYTIADASGVLTVTDENGERVTFSPRGWFRVTDRR